MYNHQVNRLPKVGLQEVFLDRIRLINYRRTISGVAPTCSTGPSTSKSILKRGYRTSEMIDRKVSRLKSLRSRYESPLVISESKIYLMVKCCFMSIFSLFKPAEESIVSRPRKLQVCQIESLSDLPLYGRLD